MASYLARPPSYRMIGRMGESVGVAAARRPGAQASRPGRRRWWGGTGEDARRARPSRVDRESPSRPCQSVDHVGVIVTTAADALRAECHAADDRPELVVGQLAGRGGDGRGRDHRGRAPFEITFLNIIIQLRSPGFSAGGEPARLVPRPTPVITADPADLTRAGGSFSMGRRGHRPARSLRRPSLRCRPRRASTWPQPPAPLQIIIEGLAG